MSDTIGKQISVTVVIAFGLTGFLIGFVAGMSLTPVVGTMLPLLFAVIGGGSGFFAARKPEYSRRVGLCLSLLTSMCLVGTVWGIHLRTGTRLSCFFSTCKPEQALNRLGLELPAGETAPDTLAEFIQVRNDIEHLNIDDAEKQRLFKAVVAHPDKLVLTENLLRYRMGSKPDPVDVTTFGMAKRADIYSTKIE